MTAVDYVAQAAEMLGQHRARGFAFDDECLCGLSIPETLRDGPAGVLMRPDRRAHLTHQAEVLAAAGLIPTSTEWAVRHSQGIRLERHERTAREELGPMLATFERNFRDKVRPSVVSHAVTDWKDATDD